MPAKKKAKAKAKIKKLKRRFNLKDGGIPLNIIIKGLDLVIKSNDDPDEAERLKGVLEGVVTTLAGECGGNRWTVEV
jgi:hypothetical protein